MTTGRAVYEIEFRHNGTDIDRRRTGKILTKM